MIKTENDFKMDVALAGSRFAKTWQNVQIRWSEMLSRCEQPKRTGETVAEYAKMDKERQAQKKDVGGFVGGILRDGKRRNGHVVGRSMATLDIDFGTGNVWEDFTDAYSCAAMIYTTHKHTPMSPRYRLVIPFKRLVQPWEYEPVCRRIAANLGIEMFDHTTYELPRLFYWPSASEDGMYLFDYQDGIALDPDEVLATYTDPRDASTWPYGKKENITLSRDIKRAGEPADKPGLIGAFCRTYTIEDAIDKFLADAYEPTAQEGRYTYRGGSVSGGLVCYRHRYAYSHHDTDPASRMLCNAFDLVRIHLFGGMDEGKDAQDVTKLPSYARMLAFAGTDGKVNREMQEKREADYNTMQGMQGADEHSEADGGEWKEQLESDKRGTLSNSHNILLVLKNDPALAGKLWHDDFSGYGMADMSLPWPRKGNMWSDSDDAQLRLRFDTLYHIQGREKIADALEQVFLDYRRHPVREYLSALKWDGVERLDRLIISYLGAEDNELNRQMTRKHFTAAVARVFQPGCKYDYCLILTGGEGIGKSTLLKAMGGQWFTDSITTTEGKEGMESLRQAWIVELAELASIRRSDVEQVKSYITKQDDKYRKAYGKRNEVYPRQCVFCGTTNELSFLKGDTGNRRFWVIPVDASLRCMDGRPFDTVGRDRNQLWAEAVVRYRNGESLYLSEEMEADARNRQTEYNVDCDDPVPGMLDEYLDMLLPADWYAWDVRRRQAYIMQHDPLGEESIRRTKVFAGEFLFEALGLTPRDKDYPYKLKQVNKLLKSKKEWECTTIKVAGYGAQKGFRLL